MNQTLANIDELKTRLKKYDQDHVLKFWDELSAEQQQNLSEQVAAIDFDLLKKLATKKTDDGQWAELAAAAETPPAITLEQFGDSDSYEAAYAKGAEALKAGKVGMILTAGGQGSRLGFEHPKGMYPIGPLSDRTLYQIILEHTHARAKQFDTRIPMYIMSSPPTHEESTKFLTENKFFNYPKDDVRIFCQGVMPAVNADGKLLLADKDRIFVSPDGHGGTLAALDASGSLQDLIDRGVEYVFYGQIDNPLIQVCNPALIGYHIQKQSELTSQVVRKNEPLQKVGNVVSVDGRVQIIEYSDLPEEFARQTGDDGNLRLWAGSIAVHIFNTAFLKRASSDADSLPFHLANKKVPFIDENGKLNKPDSPNAVKFEKFIFDLMPLAKNSIVCEVDPADGFCAVKNAPPAPSETPAHVKQAISDLHTRWLKECGVTVADGVTVEINPFFAVDQRQLKEKADSLSEISESQYLV